MQELSMNVLDIVQNSISAKAKLISICVNVQMNKNLMCISIDDNGIGMDEEKLSQVVNPFYTTRTTRSVGLGVPFFKMSATMTGGDFEIKSTANVGTFIKATYVLDHIDLMPLGDMTSTMITLISLNPRIDFLYRYIYNKKEFILDTREIKNELEDIEINRPEVISFIKEFIEENTNQIKKEG